MVNFTVDEIRSMMSYKDNIRNMSVIAHVDHGKSTLTDSLIASAGIIAKAKAGDARFMDTREDEQNRTITIKSTSVSLYFEMLNNKLVGRSKKIANQQAKAKEDFGGIVSLKDGSPFLINLIDSPGHVDFSSEVTAALRVTDGALVVVDCVEGVCVQTETVLRQAIKERIKPVLWINKLDRMFLELHMDLETMYQNFARVKESVNVIVATYKDDIFSHVQVEPEDGTVGFGSGLQSWGFTITKFADLYSAKFGVKRGRLMKKLWGDNYWNTQKNKFTSKGRIKGVDGKPDIFLQRNFVLFILKPISTLVEAVMSAKVDIYENMLKRLNVKIPKDAVDLVGKPLLKRIMQTWLPASEALMEMLVNHLPAPSVAQAYRVDILYDGDLADDCAKAVRQCDPNGPLMMYISKMVPTSEKGRFYAFGRVFSGTIATGQAVRIMGPDFKKGERKDLFLKKIQRTVLMMGRYIEQLLDCPCGNICGLVGVDTYIIKTGTISTHKDASPFKMMSFSVAAVVKCAVDCKNASDLPKLMEGLKRLQKSDPLVTVKHESSGEHVIGAAGELHLEICLKDLREDFMKGAPITSGEPLVEFRESVSAESSQTAISKSPNKHNRIYMTAEPLGDEFAQACEDEDFEINGDAKIRARYIIDTFKWDVTDARKIWAFGIMEGKSNVLVDTTKGVQYLSEIKDSMVSAFTAATLEGVLCQEPLRGIRFNVDDVTLHADSIHRGAGQIMPPCRRVIQCCHLLSEPVIYEPMYMCEIQVPQNALAGVYSTLSARRGLVESKEDTVGSPLSNIKAALPVLESFGFTALLRQKTSGQAFPQLGFSHWQPMNGDPCEEGTQSNQVVVNARARKGMKEELPIWQDFYDKV